MSGRMTAAVFGIAPKSLRDWVERGCPRNGDGTYNTAAVFAWRLDREGERVPSVADSDAVERWQEGRATLKELEVAERLKLFLRREDVEAQWSSALLVLSQELQALPTALARRVEGATKAEVQVILDEALSAAVNRCRAVYAKAEQSEPDGEDAA